MFVNIPFALRKDSLDEGHGFSRAIFPGQVRALAPEVRPNLAQDAVPQTLILSGRQWKSEKTLFFASPTQKKSHPESL